MENHLQRQILLATTYRLQTRFVEILNVVNLAKVVLYLWFGAPTRKCFSEAD